MHIWVNNLPSEGTLLVLWELYQMCAKFLHNGWGFLNHKVHPIQLHSRKIHLMVTVTEITIACAMVCNDTSGF